MTKTITIHRNRMFGLTKTIPLSRIIMVEGINDFCDLPYICIHVEWGTKVKLFSLSSKNEGEAIKILKEEFLNNQ